MHNDLIVHAHGDLDATHLLFTAVAHSVLQMRRTNCGNDNQVLEIGKENNE